MIGAYGMGAPRKGVQAPGDYSRLMNGEEAAAVFADPPYNVPIRGHAQGRGRIKHPDFLVASGDPFLGSGTTLIAAEKVGRVCYGLEIDPSYVDVSVRRWQEYAKADAVLEGNGRTFDEVAAERLASAAAASIDDSPPEAGLDGTPRDARRQGDEDHG